MHRITPSRTPSWWDVVDDETHLVVATCHRRATADLLVSLLDRDPALVERVARAIHSRIGYVLNYAESHNAATAALTAILTPQEAEKMETKAADCNCRTIADCTGKTPLCNPSHPPPAGEIGPEWRPPSRVMHPSATAHQFVRMSEDEVCHDIEEMDEDWRALLRTERAARVKAERERDKAKTRIMLARQALVAAGFRVSETSDDIAPRITELCSRASTAEAKLAEAEERADNATNALLERAERAESALARLREPGTIAAALVGWLGPEAAHTTETLDRMERALAAALAHATGEKPKGETGESEQTQPSLSEAAAISMDMQTRRLEAMIEGRAHVHPYLKAALELSRRLDKIESQRATP